MAKLFITPLGSSCRTKFCEELQKLEYGEGAIVLPNRLLLEDVRKKYANVEAIGIDTLATKLLNLNGYLDFHQINRRSQELIINDLLKTLADQKQLVYFGELLEKPGFIKAMTSLVGQLSRSGSTQEEIVSALQNWGRSGNLGQKDKEIALLYRFYRQYLKQKQWFDLEGKYRLALHVLQSQKVKLPWKKLYFSDFYSFDAMQLELIKSLSKHCQVCIGLCYEKKLEGTERDKVFAATHATYLELEALCLDEGIEKYVAKHDVAIGCAHLIKNFGLRCAAIPKSEAVQLYCFTQREQELRYTLTRVKELLTQGVEPKQILVSVRDLNQYAGLRLIADEYGIPIKLPQTSGLAVQPLTEMLLLLMQAVLDNHDGAEAYIALLTSPLVKLLLQIDGEAINQLRQDNYFKNRTSVQQKLQEQGLLDDVLQLIDGFLEKLQTKADVLGYGKLMQNFLQQLQLERRLGTLYKVEKLGLSGMSIILQSCRQLLNVVEQLMEDYASCGQAEMPITLGEWQQIFKEAVEGENVVLQCGKQNGVLITKVINAQGLHFDYVFLLGLREGEFPKIKNENWIYDDKERKKLKEAGLELPNTSLAYAEDASFFGAAIASAHKQLVLSFFKDDQAGASAYIGAVQKLFVEVKPTLSRAEEELQEQQVVQNPVKQSASAEELSQSLQSLDDHWLQQYWGETTLEAGKADFKRQDDMLYNGVLKDEELCVQVKKQLGASFSASALEVYAVCPFQYLGQRIWRQQEFAAMEEQLTPADEGDLLHEVLAGFIGRHLHTKLTSIPLEDLQKELKAVFDEAAKNALEQGKIRNNLLWQAESPRLLNVLQRWLCYEYDDQKRWSFTPCAVEWDFSSKNGKPLHLVLTDGTRVSLNGRIDRLDSDGQRVFVTDYKRSFAPSGKDLAAGFDVQLPLYILAVAGLYKDTTTVAGGAYFVLKDGERKSFVLEQVGNENIIDSKRYTKEISLTWESFHSFAQKLIVSYIEAIYSGNFAVAPRKSCSSYCQFKDICRLSQISQAEGGNENE